MVTTPIAYPNNLIRDDFEINTVVVTFITSTTSTATFNYNLQTITVISTTLPQGTVQFSRLTEVEIF